MNNPIQSVNYYNYDTHFITILTVTITAYAEPDGLHCFSLLDYILLFTVFSVSEKIKSMLRLSLVGR